MSNMNVIFIDTETTGNEPKTDRLMEICYKLRGENKIECELFKPPLPISVKSQSVTHITNEMVAGKAPFQGSQMYQDLEKLLKENILVAHNAPFDIAILEAEGLHVPRFIDTLRLARDADPEAVIPEYNLQFLRYYLKLNVEDAKAHDAKSDVRVLEALFERLFEKIQKEETDEQKALEKMTEISKTPSLMKKFTFGKYKGMLVADILKTDRNYLEWLYNQKVQNSEDGQDVDWIYTLEQSLKKNI